MKKIILLFLLTLTLLFNINIICNVKASIDVKEIIKPLVVLCGSNYDEYLDYEGYTIVENNLNINRCGDYKIIYENDISKEKLEKKVYVKNEEELLSERCYNENYTPIYGTNNRLTVQKSMYYNGYYYFGVSEEIEEDLYNLYLLKLDNEELIFKKELVTKTSGMVVDFLFNEDEIVILLNYLTSNGDQDIMVKTITQEGNNLSEKYFYGNNYDKAIKLFMTEEYYFVVIESNSNEGSIYQNNSNKRGLYVTMLDINTKNIIGTNSILYDYDISIQDVIETDEGYLILTQYYNPTSRMRVLEFHLFSYDDESFLYSEEFKKTITEDPLCFKANDRNEIYLMTKSYDYNIKTYINNLYYIYNDLSYELLNTYYYEKEPNAILCDYLINDQNNIEVLYNLIDTSKEDMYGYMYQVIEQKEVVLEIENYSSTQMCDSFIDFEQILLSSNNSIYINEINYIKFTTLNKDLVLNNNELFIYPSLYIDGKKIQPDLNKSNINYDLEIYGVYKVKFYFNTNNVDVIIPGTIEVLPHININNNETYDINLKLDFNGKGILNNYQIDSSYVINKPGTYILKVMGKDNKSYEISFNVEEIVDNKEYMFKDKQEINIKTDLSNTNQTIKLNNNIQELDFTNSKHDYTWMYIIPLCSCILLLVSLLKKRG